MSKWLYRVVLFLILAGCQGQPAETLTPMKTLDVEVAPALAWITPTMAKCALESSVNLDVKEIGQNEQSLDAADILIRWTASKAEGGENFNLGQDQLAVIVHPQNPVSEISVSQMVEIYSGLLRDWSSLDDKYAGSIHSWVYPIDSDLQVFFGQTVLPVEELTILNLIAPNPKSLLEAVSQDPAAVGFIPSRWLNPSVKELPVNGTETARWSQPILAVTKTSLEGVTRDWLLCVQDVVQQ